MPCNPAKFGIDRTPSKYGASVADTNADTFDFNGKLCVS